MESMKRRDTGPSKHMQNRIMALMVLLGVVAFFALAMQLFRIQIIDHEMYESMAIQQQMRQTPINAARGTIFDRNGTILAKSASVENIFISPVEMRYHDEDGALIAAGLSRILEVDETYILNRMQNRNSYYEVIRRMVDHEMANEVRAFIVEHGIRSVHIAPAARRFYPRERTASHILGFVGFDQVGMGYGIEGSYDAMLTGTNGRIVRLKSSVGVDMLRANYENYYPAVPGSDLVLSIDSNIQQIMEKHMEQAVRDFDLQAGGFAVALDPRDGAVLGMVSKNDFNPNNHSTLDDEILDALRLAHPDQDDFQVAMLEALQESWRNKAVNYSYEPGSTFKLITLAIALEEGIVHPDDGRMFYCGGKIEVAGRTKPVNCWRREGHGMISLCESIRQSCNVASVQLALEIGPERFFAYLEAFGLFEQTGIDLPAESVGQVWSRADWETDVSHGNLSSLAAASFGQTFTLSPIRMATVVAALTNGGYILEPYVVERVVDGDGTVMTQNGRTVRRQVISRETSDAVLLMMEQVVADTQIGTGRNAKVPGFRIGGKTGTSVDTVIEAVTGRTEYIVSFVSAAPIDDPQIVLLVSLQSPGPRNTTYVSGGQMAAPTAGKMLAEILPYMGIPFCNEDEAIRVNTQVPHVIRRTAEQAQGDLEELGFAVELHGEGERVVSQLPAAGAMVVTGTRVILFLDDTRLDGNVTVPDVVGMSYEAARAIIEANDLYVRRSGAIADGVHIQVYRQSRAPAEVVKRGSVIELSLIDITQRY